MNVKQAQKKCFYFAFAYKLLNNSLSPMDTKVIANSLIFVYILRNSYYNSFPETILC
jgi:hypothetical protein